MPQELRDWQEGVTETPFVEEPPPAEPAPSPGAEPKAGPAGTDTKASALADPSIVGDILRHLAQRAAVETMLEKMGSETTFDDLSEGLQELVKEGLVEPADFVRSTPEPKSKPATKDEEEADVTQITDEEWGNFQRAWRIKAPRKRRGAMRSVEFDQANSDFASQLARCAENGLAPVQAGESDLNSAVQQAIQMAEFAGGSPSGAKRVPIRPIGSTERRAILVAQAMIDRLSSDESDEPDLQHEFEYDPKLLMQLKVDPMRGLRSAMIGRKRDPVAIFLDYSGSCNHVADFFGLIASGFANEGGTLLIGGNGQVNSVYQPFPGRPLHLYAQDIQAVRSRHGRNPSSAGITLHVESKPLHQFNDGPLIACTDTDSYDELMLCKPRTVQLIWCAFEEQSNTYQAFFEGMRMPYADMATIQAKIPLSQQSPHERVQRTIDLCLRQYVWPVNDLETLRTALSKVNSGG